MTADDAVVFVVDDDPSVREAISSLLRSVRLGVVEFESARDFLGHPRPTTNACLILDVRMPGLSGLDLQQQLSSSTTPLPIIFITGHGDIPMAVRAIKAGAIEFLPKPFRDEDLLSAVSNALRRDEAARHERLVLDTICACYATLTEREREVLLPIVKGTLNKQVGAALGISEQTVKVHRHNIMRKMGATSLPDLVRMIETLKASGTLPA
jgi:FixJ family two-component response regulator